MSPSDKGMIIFTCAGHTSTVANTDEEEAVFCVTAKHIRWDWMKMDAEAREGWNEPHIRGKHC